MTETTATKLLTGDEYLESLRDGRSVYIDGEKVDDVTEHPAFRNSARSIARLYDALQDPGQPQLLPAEDRQGIVTHKLFMPSYSGQELVEARDAIAAWARPDPCRVRGPELRRPAREGQGGGLRPRLHRSHRHGGDQTHFPALVRGDGGVALGQPAVPPTTGSSCSSCCGTP